MKIKTQPRIIDSSNQLHQDVLKQLQSVVDDVRSIGKGGLSFDDAQLPFQYREVMVTNNVPVSFIMQQPYSILGCIPIQTFGTTVLSYKSIIANNQFNVILGLSTASSLIGFLMIGS